MNKLSYLLLETFFQKEIYNLEAIRNSINLNSDYYEYDEEDAEKVIKRFVKKNIIVKLDLIGDVYTITEEGKKLYKIESQKTKVNENTDIQVEITKKNLVVTTRATKKKRIPIPSRIKSRLQKEINSSYPFCISVDVEHFQIHHIDEDPSNNTLENLIMLCPTCHSKITKGDISKEAVYLRKKSLINPNGSQTLANIFKSKQIFQANLSKVVSEPDSIYYAEIRDHWNCYSLIEESSFLNELIKQYLPKSIEYGLLPLIADIVKKNLYYDKDSKYVYNQDHVYMHSQENEGYNLPVYYHIRFIGILYATAISNRVDIDLVSRNYKNMQSIYSEMIRGMIDNLNITEIDHSKEYPTNYHWLIGEIFSLISNWFDQFNEKQNFSKTSSYLNFIPFNAYLCLSELFRGKEKNKISTEFIVSRYYYGILTHYFSPLLNNLLRESIEENVIENIPNDFVEPLLTFALDEAYAITYSDFLEGRFGIFEASERKIVNQLRSFLLACNKI